MTITVTQSHIDHGCILDCDSCPIALALMDATKTHWSVGERFLDCIVSDGGESHRVRVPVPRRVTAFIRRFDRDKPCQPFRFRLTVPA